MKAYSWLVSVPLVLLGTGVFATPQWCVGKVPNVLTHANGELIIFSTWRNDWTALCSVSGERAGVSVAVCRSWLAILLSAQAQGKTVIVQYGNAPTCDALPTYGSTPAPGYVRIDDTR